MAQWVTKTIDRPDADVIAALGQIPTSILSDCMNRFQALSAAVSRFSGEKLAGPAVTVQAMPGCNWGAHQALGLAQLGDCIVIAAGGAMNSAVWGHVMTFAAQKIGVAGVVIDGCIRDAEENRQARFPIFCRGACPGGPHKGWQENINVPVSCAGVAVLPGDIVVGDDNGVVVVPRARAQEVLQEARERGLKEEDWYRRLESGERTIDLFGIEPV